MKTWLAIALTAALGHTARADKPPPDPTKAQLAALRVTAGCADPASPFRAWCPIADYATGDAKTKPPATMLGVTIKLHLNGDVAKELVDEVSVSTFAVGADGKVTLAALTPSNPGETDMIAQALMSVTMVLKHRAKVAEVPADLATYVHGLTGKYEPKRVGNEWRWLGGNPSTMRKVGDVWVVIETVAGEGLWASVFTDRWR
jgi:hypothetical protein